MITGIPAFIIGIKTLRRIRRGEASEKGTQFARMGVLLGLTSTVVGTTLILSVFAIIFLAISQSEMHREPPETLQAKLDEFVSFPNVAPDLKPSHTANFLHFFRIAGLRDEDEEGNTEILVLVAQVRPGLFVFTNRFMEMTFREQFSSSHATSHSRTFKLNNEHGLFEVIRLAAISNNGKKLNCQYGGVVPLGEQSVIVSVQVTTEASEELLTRFTEAIAQAESSPEVLDELLQSQEFKLTQQQVFEIFVGLKQPAQQGQ